MITGTGQRLIPRKLLEWIKGLKKGEGAGLNISTLTDSKGNPRFVEGNGVINESLPSGVEISYCKWSLSGTHLMLVIAGTIADTTAISNNTLLAEFIIPSFIADKIYSVWGVNIETKNIPCVAENWSIQQLNVVFLKVSGQSKLQIRTSGGATFTATAGRGFRMQFDLLIDSE